ncbi:MAG TPA: WYL domain-containing protein [Longimicrobiales bacterium]|nr:WYL domain-containing protein [Longimicrobiales bacterium]
MSRRASATERLERILRLLPAAVKASEEGDGLDLAEAAGIAGVPADQVLEDLREVSGRNGYQPAGEADRIQIDVRGDRIRVWTAGQFRRPVRLTPGEALALSLGLRRLLACGSPGEREARLALARRLERELTAVPAEELEEVTGRIALEAPEGEDEAHLARLDRAARERRRCRLSYLKPAASEAEERTLCPYLLASAEGRWYAVGRSEPPGEVRVFRLDRILEVSLLEDTFEVPPDFEPSDYISGGRVYRGGEEIEALVRYSPEIARWVRERWDGERAETWPDGSLLVRHRVADEGWLVRHVLQYGPEAEVLAPEELRAAVREAARRVEEGSRQGTRTG